MSPSPDYWSEGRRHDADCYDLERGPDGAYRRIHTATCHAEPALQPAGRPLPAIPPASKLITALAALRPVQRRSDETVTIPAGELAARREARGRDDAFLR